jgi:tRNA(Arg) A34 adenosine deaminase TadA
MSIQRPITASWAYCHVAHAEINALAGLPPTQHYEDHILLTTLEPCCMCLGAGVQSTITRVHFAGRDPYGGASDLVIDTPQARRRPMAVTSDTTAPMWARR